MAINEQKKKITLATAQQIRYYRQLKNMSQEELALRAELNPAYLGQLERGLKCPTIDTLYRIAGALSLSLSELFIFDNKSSTAMNSAKQVEAALRGLPDEKQEHIVRIVKDLSALLRNESRADS
jgi:transcriptional regulator with XRE-family HTH domain